MRTITKQEKRRPLAPWDLLLEKGEEVKVEAKKARLAKPLRKKK